MSFVLLKRLLLCIFILAFSACAEFGLQMVSSSSFVLEFNTTRDASIIGSTEISLVTNTMREKGAANSLTQIADFSNDFCMSFELNFGSDATGGDGIGIVFHNDPEGANLIPPGNSGAGIGAGGISNGIVLELDTFRNTPSQSMDLNLDHGHIWDTDVGPAGNAGEAWSGNGSLNTPIALPFSLEDGLFHRIIITWNATNQRISYTIDGVLAGEYNGNIEPLIDNQTSAFLSIIGSNGSRTNPKRLRFNQNEFDCS